MTGDPVLRDADYQQILQFRTRLRRFLHWSEQQARRAGLTASQHQLLLAVRGHPGPGRPTIGDLAGYLLLRHHSVVGLVDRCVLGGWVVRQPDRADHRVVRVELTLAGEHALEHLTALHLAELRNLAQATWPTDPG
ncbi:MAG: MarR family winged helix-turn-helix transcriptional regulator [Actinomycetes bacterium]